MVAGSNPVKHTKESMKDFARLIVGALLIITASLIIMLGVWHRHELWTGIITKTVIQKVEVDKPTNWQDTVNIGPAKVEDRWYIIDKTSPDCVKDDFNCAPTGQYQLRTLDNRLFVMKFCNPVPDIKEDSIVDITIRRWGTRTEYAAPDCTIFVSAKIIKEPK